MGGNSQNTPELETERLLLRRFCADDLPALFAIYSDETVNTYLPWFPLKSEEEARAFYEERYAAEYAKARAYHYALCLKTDNLPVGYVNVSSDVSHDLGFGLQQEFWRRGMMTEACTAVLERVKRDGFLYITATHDIKNPRSGNVMRRLGMEYKYSYRELWQPKNRLVTFRMYQLNFDGDEVRVYKKYWDLYPDHFIEELV